jgi:hypothetical protein
LFHFEAWNETEDWDATARILFQIYEGTEEVSLSIFIFKLTMVAVHTSDYRIKFYKTIRRLFSQKSPP